MLVRHTALNEAPFFEMSSHDLFRLLPISGLFDPAYVQCAILSVEAANATHVVSIVSKLITSETVLGAVGERCEWVRDSMQVLAFPAIRTAPAREKKTCVFDASGIRPSETCVLFDVAARLRFRFAAEFR
jgi:hypothetical protein